MSASSIKAVETTERHSNTLGGVQAADSPSMRTASTKGRRRSTYAPFLLSFPAPKHVRRSAGTPSIRPRASSNFLLHLCFVPATSKEKRKYFSYPLTSAAYCNKTYKRLPDVPAMFLIPQDLFLHTSYPSIPISVSSRTQCLPQSRHSTPTPSSSIW